MSGTLEIGTTSSPIADGVRAKLVFADRGGTSTSIDPERFAPGAVLMGPVKMHGKAKTSWLPLQIHPSAGSNVLTLASVATGWEAGDQLVVAATTFGDPTSDDLVSIASISNNNITLTSPLVHDHKAPAMAKDLDVHVANLSRNIKISSENSSVSMKRRGHLMFMHNLNVDIRYVELTNIGRTDKSIPLDDYTWDDLQESPDFEPPRGAYKNPRGRYSIHFHRGGFDPTLSPALVQGVTANNDPGWAFVNHSSRVDFVQNVSYDVLGGAYMTEAGDETGSFVENIALRTVNPIDPLRDPRAENALVDIREEFQDFSWQGDAFWFHSNGVSIEGNIAAGVTGHAFVFWPEGLIEKGLGMRKGDISKHITDPAQRAALNGVDPSFVLECWLIPSKPFTNNTAYTIRKGLVGYYVHTRFLDETEEKNNVPTEAYRNTLNAVFDKTTLWNIQNKGVEFVFASDITLQNSRIVGYGSPSSAIGIAVNHWHNFDDWFFTNNTIEGFNNQNIGFIPPANAQISIDGGTFNNSSTDIEIRETNFPRDILEDEDTEANIGQLNRTMTISNVNFQNPNRNIVMNPQFTLNQEPQDGIDFSENGKDVFYFLLNDDITLNYGPFQNVSLYFDQQAADFIPITNANYQFEIVPGEEPTDIIIPVRYRNKTNAQLQALTFNPSSSFGGELLPSSAQDHPSIVGGKVDGNVLSNTSGPEQHDIKIFPNPTRGDLNIELPPGSYQLNIWDGMGRVYQRFNINGNHTVDISQLPVGLFFVEVVDLGQKNSFVRKLLKF